MVDILVIGAMKAGSSSMHRYLGNHPEISVTRTKEVNFFIDNNWVKGVDWYAKQFKNDGLLHADVSPVYSRIHLQPEMAERAFKTNPKLKIIYVVRNPFERITSHLMHNMVTDRIPVDGKEVFEEVKNNVDYLKTSNYYYQIREYLKFFDSKHVMIVDNSELKNNFKNELARIYNFLGVDSQYSEQFENKIYNSSANKRQIKGYDFVYKHLNYKIPREIWFRFYDKFGKKINRPSLEPECKSFIKGKLIDDYERFDEIFSTQITNYLK